MQRHRVVDLRANLSRREKVAQFVTTQGADNVLMLDVSRVVNLAWKNDVSAGVEVVFGDVGCLKESVVLLGYCAASIVSSSDVLEFDL